MKEYADIQTQRSIGQIGLLAAVRCELFKGPLRADSHPSLAPHLHQRLPHDAYRIPRPIVRRDTALSMTEYLH
jgi:hypothetical protein